MYQPKNNHFQDGIHVVSQNVQVSGFRFPTSLFIEFSLQEYPWSTAPGQRRGRCSDASDGDVWWSPPWQVNLPMKIQWFMIALPIFEGLFGKFFSHVQTELPIELYLWCKDYSIFMFINHDDELPLLFICVYDRITKVLLHSHID